MSNTIMINGQRYTERQVKKTLEANLRITRQNILLRKQLEELRAEAEKIEELAPILAKIGLMR